MLTLKIPEDILQQMLDQARAEAPVEACGILAGSDGQVCKLYKMTNADDSSERTAATAVPFVPRSRKTTS